MLSLGANITFSGTPLLTDEDYLVGRFVCIGLCATSSCMPVKEISGSVLVGSNENDTVLLCTCIDAQK